MKHSQDSLNLHADLVYVENKFTFSGEVTHNLDVTKTLRNYLENFKHGRMIAKLLVKSLFF